MVYSLPLTQIEFKSFPSTSTVGRYLLVFASVASTGQGEYLLFKNVMNIRGYTCCANINISIGL